MKKIIVALLAQLPLVGAEVALIKNLTKKCLVGNHSFYCV